MSYCGQFRRNATEEFDTTSDGTFRRLKNPGGELSASYSTTLAV